MAAGETDGGAAAPGSDGNAGAPAAPVRARIGDFTRANAEQPTEDEPIDPSVQSGTGGDEPTLDEAASAAGDQPDPLEEQTEEPAEFDESPIFGVEPAALLAALRKGEMTDDLVMQMIEAVPQLKELHRMGMRSSDYSRKTAEVANIRRQAEGVLQQDQQRWQTWSKDPSAMYDELEQRGMVSLSDIINKRGPLVEIAMHIAETYGAFKKMSPPEQEAFLAEQRAITKERELQEKERKLQERERGYRHQELTAKHANDLRQMVPAAFAKVKLQDSKLAQKVFKDRLGEIVNGLERFNGLSQEMVDAAAMATVETLRELARFGGPEAAAPPARGVPQVRQPQRQAGGPPPPTPLNGGRPGTRQQPQSGPQRARIGDFSQLKRGN